MGEAQLSSTTFRESFMRKPLFFKSGRAVFQRKALWDKIMGLWFEAILGRWFTIGSTKVFSHMVLENARSSLGATKA